MPAPAFMIRMIMGELGGTLLVSQKVIPERLLRYGYKFRFPQLAAALQNLIAE
jgi:NAD dependent epimerase/dehydratase family enzyme